MKALRGRTNRATYWATLAVLAVFLGIAASVIDARPPLELFLILVCVPRLHDFGGSGWWILVPIGIEIGAGIIGLIYFTANVEMVIGLAVIIIGLILIALGIVPGEPGTNRFGPPPRRGVQLWGPKPAKVEDTFD